MAILTNLVNSDTFLEAGEGGQVIKNIPMNFGQWHGEDKELGALVHEILRTDSIIHRSYRNQKGQEVFLSLVYYKDSKVDFHAPESCLGGQGISTVKESKLITINSAGRPIEINLNQLLHTQDNTETLVYYFYKAGNFLGKSYVALRLNLALNKFGKVQKSGSLIRISTPISNIDTQHKNAEMILKDFIEELYPYIILHL